MDLPYATRLLVELVHAAGQGHVARRYDRLFVCARRLKSPGQSAALVKLCCAVLRAETFDLRSRRGPSHGQLLLRDYGAAHLRYDGVTVTGVVARVWTGGLITRLNLSLGWRDFAGPFPLTSTPRADDMVRVELDLQHSRIEVEGLPLVMTCIHTVNGSNLACFDYTATVWGVSLSRNF